MASVTYEKNRSLFESGHPIHELFLVLRGSLSISFPGGEYTLSKGDIAGICELCDALHFTSCRALEDTAVLTYPVSDITSLESFFHANPDYSILFIRSAFRQINALLHCYELARIRCNELYADFTKDYSFYNVSCMHYKISAQSTPAMQELSPVLEDSPLESWAVSYYDEFEHFLSENSNSSALSKVPAITIGLVAGIFPDFLKTISSIEALSEYQSQVLSLYLNEDGCDLLSFYANLYEKSDVNSPDFAPLQASITQMLRRLQNAPGLNRELYTKYSSHFESILKAKPVVNAEPEKESVSLSSFLPLLSDSLQSILSYSEANDEFCRQFQELIERYRNAGDKNATDDDSRKLRQQISASFYKLYSLIFFKAAKDPSIPLPVRMFLYFGYVDELLAGTENAAYLAQLADFLSKESYSHTFTLFDWLVAILNGQREPSRNEFDEDFTAYLHNLKISGNISAKDEAAFSKDTIKKVEYELKNMLPPVNRITSGRISTFCPVFSAHNVLKTPDESFVSNDALEDALRYTVSLDFSAYYREYIYTNAKAGIPKEFLHSEKLPDFILMPGIGTRGIMWQEIEGRRRNTSARMMLPIFYLDDLRSAIVRLTGEYRWEMCKRIQGSHWNDLAERSLTSEYFDYIQFYKKNHDLSPAAKEKIKAALQKSRGSFKEMFVRDYMTYILFEGTGSPRLTKTARSILTRYCPFSKPVRESLSANPIFKEVLDRYELHQKQQIHRFELIMKKIENSGCEVPQEILNEWEFLNT